MSDQDFYTGYAYAAIRKNANKVARLAMENVRTESEKEDFIHPYLPLITDSNTFSEHQFWRDISTFLDLEGVYYLMAIRAAADGRFGEVQEFKMLNPYNIKRVLSGDQLEVVGYVETRKGMTREISKDMIIEIRDLNPFSEDAPFSMSDAARESQYTLKTGGDYTRNALKHNINAPGIITTDVILDKEQFENFTERVKQHTKGEPLFGNGAGAIDWKSMETDLSKAAIKDVQTTSRESLFTVAGVSKTIMGIEESGTTRETANIQKDLNTEDFSMPRIQLIADAMNLDYIRHYQQTFEGNKVYIVIDNPLKTDHDADLKEAQVKTAQFELLKSMVNAGVDTETAAKYVCGEVELEEIGEVEKTAPIDTTPTDTPTTDNAVKNQAETKGIIQQQSGQLKNAIVNVEQQLAIAVINHVRSTAKNAFDVVSEIISASQKKDAEREITAVLTSFYGTVFKVEGANQMRSRASEFGMMGSFSIGRGVSNEVSSLARKVSESHVSTVLDDLLVTTREAALRGDSIDQIVSAIKGKYSGTVVQQRANTIARTETNRAFTRAQYEADKQFIDQNGLEQRAFKQWRTRSNNPCAYCQQLEAEGPQPFDTAFRELGSSVSADGKSLPVSFESLEAGNAHPNCSCDYELIITQEDFADVTMNKFEKEFVEENGVGYVEKDNAPGLPAAQYNHRSKLITVYDKTGDLEHTIHHELAHAIDELNGSKKLSSSVAKSAIKEDGKSVVINRVMNSMGVTRKEATAAYEASSEATSKMLEYYSHPTEVFADAYAQFRKNSSKFKKTAPSLYAIFKSL